MLKYVNYAMIHSNGLLTVNLEWDYMEVSNPEDRFRDSKWSRESHKVSVWCKEE